MTLLMAKVRINDRRVYKTFKERAATLFAVLSGVLIFVDIPEKARLSVGFTAVLIVALLYVALWRWANDLQHISVDIEGSTVDIKVGNLFDEPGFKAISFNEFFDTIVDDRIISNASLNGIFINEQVGENLSALDEHIDHYNFDDDAVVERGIARSAGRTTRYKLGTICVYGEFLLTALTKFDKHDNASLTMPEYLGFLIAFWDQVNRVYAQRSVSAAIFGSGITRIKGHSNIAEEDLLKIMLWTFRISEMRFKYPAKLTIVIHPDKIDTINLLDIKSVRNGV